MEEPLDFGGNPDHITVGLELWLRFLKVGPRHARSATLSMFYAAFVI